MQKRHYRSVFASIFGTYLAVCMIVLSVAGIGYVNDYNILKRHVLELSGQQAEQVMTQLEGEFERVNAMLEVLSTDILLKEAMEKSDAELSRDASDIRKLIATLNSITQMDSRLHVLVYFLNSDSVLDASRRRYNTQMMELFYKENELSPEEFYGIMDFAGSSDSYVLKDGRVWLMKSVYDSGYKKRAVLIGEINMDRFIDVKFGGNIFALAAGDVVIYASGDDWERVSSYVKSGPEEKWVPDADEPYMKRDGCYFVRHEMDFMGWQCYVGIAENSLSEGLRMFWYILALELVGAGLLVLLLSLYSARRMYKPIGQMLQLLGAEKDVKLRDTYGMLAGKLEKLLGDNRRMLKKTKNSQIFLDNYQVGRILNGEITSESAAEGMELLTGIPRQGCWVMALMRVSDKTGGVQTDGAYDSGGELNLQYFVLQNIVRELILDRFDAGGIYWREEHYCLFVGQKEEADYGELQEKLEYMADFYENMLHMPLYIECGQPRMGFGGVEEQYKELLGELKYHIFWHGESVHSQLWMQPPVGQNWSAASFGEYMEASRKLYNFLQAEEYAKAYEMLNYIFQETFSKDPKYLKYNIYRMYGVATMLTMAIEEQANEDYQAFFERLSFEERLGGVDSVEEFMSISKELFDQIIQYKADNGKETPVWLDQVVLFLQENYRDQNLSVSDVADRFWISVPHLSRTFKKYMEYSVLEYIQLLRVEEAKKLLAEGKNVTEASVEVGYLDAKALTRAFKKYEGITPGKYREMMLQKK